MKTTKQFILIIILAFSIQAIGQDNIKPFKITGQQIGIQINPGIDQRSIHASVNYYWVYALRYKLILASGFSIGPELSGFSYKDSEAIHQSYKIGAFFRYSFLKEKKINPFIESSLFYSFFSYKPHEYIASEPFHKNEISYYIAPGFSFNLYKNILKFDFMVKSVYRFNFSSFDFTPTYRINFVF